LVVAIHGLAIRLNASNNINGINGDPSGNDNGEEIHSLVVPAITSLQEAYVRKVVDTLNDLDKVIFSDIDPKLLASSTSYSMVWKSLMRGFNPIYLESDLANLTAAETVRNSMGYALKYSHLVDLSSMSPSSEVCSSGYCLINPGREYLVYLPAGGTVRVDLSAASGSFIAS